MWMLIAPITILGGIAGILGIFFALRERAANRAARERASSRDQSPHASRA